MYPYFNNQNQISNFPVYNSSFPQTSPRLVCRQVGSIEEAKSAIIDPISLYLFVDFSSGRIYVKKMGDNGQSEFYQYAQVAEPKPVDPMDEIRQRLSNIEAKLGGKHEPVSVSEKPDAGITATAGTENATE